MAVLCHMACSMSAMLSRVSKHGARRGKDGLKTCLIPFLPLLVDLSLYKGLTCLWVLSTFVGVYGILSSDLFRVR